MLPVVWGLTAGRRNCFLWLNGEDLVLKAICDALIFVGLKTGAEEVSLPFEIFPERLEPHSRD